MNVLIVNLHSFHNAGDAILTQVSMQQLKDSFPDSTIVLSMNDPDSYKGAETTVGSFVSCLKKGANGRTSWRWAAIPGLIVESLLALGGYRLFGRPVFLPFSSDRKDLVRAYLEADIVVSCAGGFLYTSGRFGLPLLVSVSTMAYAWLAGKPLYTLPQTIGPLRRRWERILVKCILPKVRMVLVRDPISLEELRAIGLEHPCCHLVSDIAFAFPGAPRGEGERLLAEHGVDMNRSRPLLGLTLLNWAAQNRLFDRQEAYEEAMAEVIRTFILKYDGHVVLFSQVHGPTEAEDDRVPARRVYAKVRGFDQRVSLVEQAVAPDVLKAAYGLMDFFVGTRLHSNIFALSEGVPVVAIEYQYKTRGIMRMLGLERWVISIGQTDVLKPSEVFQEAWLEREQTREMLQQIMPTIVGQASRAGAMIAADFAEQGVR